MADRSQDGLTTGGSPRNALTPGARLGAYEVLAPIGAGGMGEVYKARDTRLDRTVAIKVLPAHLASDPVARKRLRHEALAAAGLDHPFICKIFEIGEDNGGLFIVMEFVAGETLHARLAAGRFPPTEALRIASELAEALEEAHSKCFVHRDLKPTNVMLTRQGHVKVLDFGLAKRFQLSSTDATITVLTQEGMPVGTPKYMSPEHVKGEPIDPRSDLFSFGILLCELLGGENPFCRSTPVETMTAILRDPPNLPADLPQGLMVLIRRLLAKVPAERYQSAKELRVDLTLLATASPAAEAPAERRLPLIGREAERAELFRALDRAMAGRGSLVMIGGEPGIGKTRLTQAILEEARRRGVFGAVGHCCEMEGAAPYVPFVEILEYSAQVAPPESFRYAVGDDAPEIAKLMPGLRRMFPDIPPPLELPLEQQRRFLFNAFRDFNERSARLTPVVAVFEDLHWADEPTLLLLQHLAQTVATVPALLLGTYRDVELDVTHPFANMLETVTRQRIATRMTLRRLPVGGVEAMLGAMSGNRPPPSLARVVFEETEGNPFFVEEVFRHLSDEGKLFDESGAWRKDLRIDRLEVPEGVRLVIGKRLQRLSEETRRVLTTASVIGRRFSLGLLEALESARPDAALEALEEAERAQLVTAENVGREPHYRFVHELIRQTLAEALSLPRRQRLHARIAQAMEKVYAAALDKHASALAHHLYQAGMAADVQRTVSYLLRAADGAQRIAAHEEALGHLDNAVSLLEGEAGKAMAEVHERRAKVLRSLGRLSDAVAAYEEAIALFESAGERVRAATACVPLNWMYHWATDWPRAEDALQRGIDLASGAESSLRARLLSLKGLTWTAAGRIEEGLVALAEAESMCPPGTGADLYLSQAFGYFHSTDFARSLAFQQKADEASRAAGDLWLQAEIRALRFMLRTFMGFPAQPGQVEPLLEKAVRMGQQNAIYLFRLALDRALISRGELGLAERSTGESIRFSDSLQSRYQFTNQLHLAAIYDFQGRDDEMLHSLCRAIEDEPQSSLSGISQAAQFRARAIRGDAGSIELLSRGSVSMPVPGRRNRVGAWWALVCAVTGLAALGRCEDAAALRPSTEEFLLTGAEFAWPFSTARTAAGIAAACSREWTRAEEHHTAAIHVADTTPLRILQPMTRAWYAEMLALQGNRAQARVMLGEALALFESMGMPGYAQRASGRLSNL